MEKQQASLMHDFNEKKKSSFPTKILGLFLVVVLAGVGTGFLLADRSEGTTPRDASVPEYSVSKGETFGTDEISDFPDTAEGTLREGGIDGEGAYHLERPGGKSQNVYLTSSLVDLSQLVGRKIKVWGATQTAQKAGWLMDVGRVEVL